MDCLPAEFYESVVRSMKDRSELLKLPSKSNFRKFAEIHEERKPKDCFPPILKLYGPTLEKDLRRCERDAKYYEKLILKLSPDEEDTEDEQVHPTTLPFNFHARLKRLCYPVEDVSANLTWDPIKTPSSCDLVSELSINDVSLTVHSFSNLNGLWNELTKLTNIRRLSCFAFDIVYSIDEMDEDEETPEFLDKFVDHFFESNLEVMNLDFEAYGEDVWEALMRGWTETNDKLKSKGKMFYGCAFYPQMLEESFPLEKTDFSVENGHLKTVGSMELSAELSESIGWVCQLPECTTELYSIPHPSIAGYRACILHTFVLRDGMKLCNHNKVFFIEDK
ncbi:hypothetical protein QR680_014300 [Steinernema hermaphroditum]|uniref:Uncharacterized protein n=1 Tax=Steinernema hermaphroditum TaxID=289476 RepID=A0AA39I9Z9_9BILA|nr:hypothetical protein QR680_014300 [Steinernema hermaphroditum]